MIKYLPYEFTTITMQPRKWKWRMRGAAFHVVDELSENTKFDGVFCSSFLSLTDLIALGPKWLQDVPKIVYFHENQLVYPVRMKKEWDFHFGLTNITTAMCADTVVFNSRYNCQSFLDAIPKFLRRFPDYRPVNVVEKIKTKIQILPPPLDPDEFSNQVDVKSSDPVCFIWNHRWEFDKNPEIFFYTLETLKKEGHHFRLIVLGEKFKEYPSVFDRARESLKDSIEHWGYIPSRQAYVEFLTRADVAVSTAVHEFFGISMMEAVAAGCYPVIPNRLAYPDIYPKQYLYENDNDLKERLIWCIENIKHIRSNNYRNLVEPYKWPNWQTAYSSLFDKI